MATTIIMPKQGQSVESCILTEWFKQKGEKVQKGDLLFAYETDKASFEEEAPEDGVLLDVLYKAGDEVPVLQPVALLGQPGEKVESFTIDKPIQEEKPSESPAVMAPVQPKIETEAVQPKPITTNTTISPRAKKLANDKGIVYQNIAGSGPEGRIITRDVELYISTNKPLSAAAKLAALSQGISVQSGTGIGGMVTVQDLSTPPIEPSTEEGSTIKPLSNIRKLIAKSMHASLQNSAQLTHHMGADARKVLAYRNEVKAMKNKGYTGDITLNDMICYAVIRALKNNPEANAHFLGDSIQTFSKIHLGLAVDTERGLMVPTLKNADDFNIEGLSAQLKQIAAQCKAGKINPDLLVSTAATFTVSNLGNYGVEMFTPIVNVPQVAILGVNTIVHRPVMLEGGMFGFAPYLGLSLTYDHRAIDGGPATKFLASIKAEIENFNVKI